jgi:hypothetical protein
MTDFQWVRLQHTVSEDPLKCGSAFTLAQRIIGNKTYTIYPRYVASVVAATCNPVFFLPGDEVRKKTIESAIVAIRESKIERARGILEQYILGLPKNKVDVSIIMAKKYLEGAKKLFESPMYFEYKGTMHGFDIPPAPIALFP